MRRKEPDSCGFAAALQAIGGKWKTSLLWELHLRPYDEMPPRVEYSITPLGFSLNDAVTVMSAWGKHHETWKSQREAA
jgi:DNA-binding HxlR family transcriptional regulator